MDHNELQQRLNELDKRSFELEKKRFDVTGVNYRQGRYYVYTRQETFVKDSSQFENMLLKVKLIPVDAESKPAFVPDKEKIILKPTHTMDTETTTAVMTAADNAKTVNEALMAQFTKISGANPTEADYKQAGEMSKLANTMVSVSQVQINFLKLKAGK